MQVIIKLENETEKAVYNKLREILRALETCEFEDNPNDTYLEGQKVENARIAIYIQQEALKLRKSFRDYEQPQTTVNADLIEEKG